MVRERPGDKRRRGKVDFIAHTSNGDGSWRPAMLAIVVYGGRNYNGPKVADFQHL